MDLKRERQIKFWLATVSKVLIIAFVSIKLLDAVFPKLRILDRIQEPFTKVEMEGDSIALSNTDTSSLTLDVNSLQPIKDSLKATNSLNTNTPANTGVGTEELKGTTKTKSGTTALTIVQDGFVWQRETNTALLHLRSIAKTVLRDMNISLYIFYKNQQDAFSFSGEKSMQLGQQVALRIPLDAFKITQLPDSVLVCITHKNDDATSRIWNRFILKNEKEGSGAVIRKSVQFNISEATEATYTNYPPPCLPRKKTSRQQTVSKSTTPVTKESAAPEEDIRAVATLFINGLNGKSLILRKTSSTARLHQYLVQEDFKNYAYGFSPNVQILSNTGTAAYVKMTLNTQGRSNYLEQQSRYASQSPTKKVDALFGFLKKDNNGWIAKLTKENGLWKFDVHP